MNTHSQTRAQSALLQEWEQEWRDAGIVDRAEAARAQQRTVRRRLVLLAPPASVAAAAPLVLPWTPGFATANAEAAIIASAVAALLAVTIVPLANQLGRSLADAGAGDRLFFTAALASAGAAAVHFSVIKMHFDEYTLYGVFFVGIAIAQLVWPIWLLLRRWPPLLVLGAIGNAAIVALWVVDRVGLVPLGPDATKPPPFGFGDTVTAGFELLLVVACIAALARRSKRLLKWPANLALTLGVATLTALAFLSVLGVGSSILPPTM